ncbi:AAEL004203-PA [Aedes aegypti]|nr:AAEL004203-PA [Aedes aegypti]
MSSYGITLSGNVSFHSAFVAKIGAMELNMQRFKHTLLNAEAQIEATMQWKNVATAMDFDADLEGFQGSGTLLVTYGHFDLPLTTKRVFATGEVSGSLAFMSISSQNDIVVVGHPNNAHVQMIARAITTNFDFRNDMIEPFRRWNFINILNVALEEIPFPEICYNC